MAHICAEHVFSINSRIASSYLWSSASSSSPSPHSVGQTHMWFMRHTNLSKKFVRILWSESRSASVLIGSFGTRYNTIYISLICIASKVGTARCFSFACSAKYFAPVPRGSAEQSFCYFLSMSSRWEKQCVLRAVAARTKSKNLLREISYRGRFYVY